MEKERLNKKSSIIWFLRHPVITVLDYYVELWIYGTAEKIAKEIIKKHKLNPQNIDSQPLSIKSSINYAAESEAEKLGEKIPGERFMVVAEGDLDFDQKTCEIVDISDFTDEVLRFLIYESLDSVHHLVKENEVSVESLENPGENGSSWEEDRVYLEHILHNYIPTIFEEDILNFVDGLSYFVAKQIKDSSIGEDEIPYIIKDEISRDIYECVTEIENLSSEYINIVKGDFTTYGVRTCKIMPVEDFINKLYKITFDVSSIRAKESLGVEAKPFFDEEFGIWEGEDY
jgi:hypothetical protein